MPDAELAHLGNAGGMAKIHRLADVFARRTHAMALSGEGSRRTGNTLAFIYLPKTKPIPSEASNPL
jgi:hypothetical protein